MEVRILSLMSTHITAVIFGKGPRLEVSHLVKFTSIIRLDRD